MATLRSSTLEEGGATLPTIAIIDPNPVFALGLKLLITRGGLGQPEVWNFVSAAARALDGQPVDMVVISERMIGEFASSPLARSGASVLIMVDGKSLADVARLRSAGFGNFLVRDSSEERIAECIGAVLKGRRWVDPMLQSNHDHQNGSHCLSKREFQVAAMAADGLSNKLIARSLNLSDGTVKIHLHHVFAKLHVSKRRELGMILGADTYRPARGLVG